MSIALLATGDELVIGDTLNTNTYEIAQRLRSEGLNPGLHLICGDDEPGILSAMRFLCDNHKTLIVIGGLGPTSDDRTRYALSALIAHPLITFHDAIQHIEMRLASVQLTMNMENRQQALFPAHAELLPNPNGTAMGCVVEWHDRQILLLPGPPRECLPMFEGEVMPFLRKKYIQSNRITRKWLLYGVAEGHIAATLDKILQDVDCQTGYRLDTPYLECKVHCNPAQLAAIEALVNPVVAPYMLTPHHKKASTLLAEYMILHPQPITIIDNLTGGQLQTAIQKPDNIQYLSFCQAANNESVRIEISGLEQYWQQQTGANEAHAAITCTQKDKIIVQEEWVMPFHYRNHPLALLFAAEWCCAKILELLKLIDAKEL